MSTLTSEELHQHIAEIAPNAVDVMSRAMSMSPNRLMAAVERGEITNAIAIAHLVDHIVTLESRLKRIAAISHNGRLGTGCSRGSTVSIPVPIIGSMWRNATSGKIYTVLLIVNEHASPGRANDYPMQVVYMDDDFRFWSKRLVKWHEKMTLLGPG